jgi:hypothetical protein
MHLPLLYRSWMDDREDLMLPFTTEQFLDVFGTYNLAIWPLQVVAYGLGLLATLLALRSGRRSSQPIAAILAFFWLWTGLVYHGLFFSAINGAALLFGLLFVLEAGLLLAEGVFGSRLVFHPHWDINGLVGGLFITYALIVYPVLGLALGQSFPRMPVFGVTPCPVTIFTFGLLLWSERPLPRRLLLIPLLWSMLGMSAAVSLGIAEDLGLVVAGLLGTALLLWRDHQAMAPRLRASRG